MTKTTQSPASESEAYICQPCKDAVAAEQPGAYNDHSCAEWGRGVLTELPDCECPYNHTWCDFCQDEHHPPVSYDDWEGDDGEEG